MRYTKLGNSDLNVSRICMGCMGFGDPNNGMHTWTLNEEESRKIIKAGIDNGINFFDTAIGYQNGTSEQYVGKAIKDFADREDMIIATKFLPRTEDEIKNNVSGQDHIKKMVDTSLENLGLTYIDLYIYHMWDYNTPLYEGFEKFVSVQGHYNLIFREEEREMIPYCKSENIGLTPYSSLASGRLSKMPDESSKRLKEDYYATKKYESTEEQDSVIIRRVIDLAREYDVSMSEISLAWLQTKVDSPIMGATKLKHIETGVNSVELKLSEDDIKYLEEPYKAHDLVGVMADNQAKANDSEKVWVRK